MSGSPSGSASIGGIEGHRSLTSFDQLPRLGFSRNSSRSSGNCFLQHRQKSAAADRAPATEITPRRQPARFNSPAAMARKIHQIAPTRPPSTVPRRGGRSLRAADIGQHRLRRAVVSTTLERRACVRDRGSCIESGPAGSRHRALGPARPKNGHVLARGPREITKLPERDHGPIR